MNEQEIKEFTYIYGYHNVQIHVPVTKYLPILKKNTENIFTPCSLFKNSYNCLPSLKKPKNMNKINVPDS